MKRFLILIFLFPSVLFSQKTKTELFQSIQIRTDEYAKIAKQIWDYAEVGFQEIQSSSLLQATLKKEGFIIQNNIAGMPTAFTAQYGTGKPVIGILGEYDALPGISQDNVPEIKTLNKSAGHACGHHLFGTASAAAATAVKNWMKANNIQGTLRFYGTPAEEGGSGKVYLVREGLFKDVDAVIHWHPGDANNASAASSFANKTGKFRFYGIASHASASPERGRSALDAVEAMDNMVNMMREHVSSDTRIHYVITRGGEAPNVVPAFAEVYYYVRHPKAVDVMETWERVVKAAQGAALGTETRMEVEVIGGVYNLMINPPLAKIMDKNLRLVGGFNYSEEEKKFGEKIQTSYKTNKSLESSASISSFVVSDAPFPASTDVGDVSWVVPTAGLGTATWVPGTAAHSWQAVAAGGTSIAWKGMIVAAKTMAGTLVDLYSDPLIIKDANEELKKRQGTNFIYTSLIGNRKPALDYRN